MGSDEFNTGGNPAMDQYPIQGEVEILLVTSVMLQKTGIRFGLMATWLVCRLNDVKCQNVKCMFIVVMLLATPS